MHPQMCPLALSNQYHIPRSLTPVTHRIRIPPCSKMLQEHLSGVPIALILFKIQTPHVLCALTPTGCPPCSKMLEEHLPGVPIALILFKIQTPHVLCALAHTGSGFPYAPRCWRNNCAVCPSLSFSSRVLTFLGAHILPQDQDPSMLQDAGGAPAWHHHRPHSFHNANILCLVRFHPHRIRIPPCSKMLEEHLPGVPIALMLLGPGQGGPGAQKMPLGNESHGTVHDHALLLVLPEEVRYIVCLIEKHLQMFVLSSRQRSQQRAKKWLSAFCLSTSQG